METLALESIRLTHVRIPLHEPFAVGGGVVSEKDAILVELKANGLTGLGEASPMGDVSRSPHTADSTWRAMIEQLIPRMNEARELGLDGEWFAGVVDDPHATCGVDTAMWDLSARRRGASVSALLGGRGDRIIESSLTLGICSTVDELLQRIDRYVRADGHRCLRISVQPGWDVEPMEAVRIRFGRMPLCVDANCAYTRQDLDNLASWDRFGLTMIEQPFPRDDLESHALLTARCRTPISLDESVESPTAVGQALRLRAGRVMVVKLQRLGGFAAALRVHELTTAAHVPCWMGSMPELGVGAHAAIHFATLPNVLSPIDVEASHRWFTADVTEPVVGCHDGALKLPPGVGLAVKLNAEVVRRYKVRDYSAALNCRVRTNIEPKDE